MVTCHSHWDVDAAEDDIRKLARLRGGNAELPAAIRAPAARFAIGHNPAHVRQRVVLGCRVDGPNTHEITGDRLGNKVPRIGAVAELARGVDPAPAHSD